MLGFRVESDTPKIQELQTHPSEHLSPGNARKSKKGCQQNNIFRSQSLQLCTTKRKKNTFVYKLYICKCSEIINVLII